jgi:hypothetical protein
LFKKRVETGESDPIAELTKQINIHVGASGIPSFEAWKAALKQELARQIGDIKPTFSDLENYNL